MLFKIFGGLYFLLVALMLFGVLDIPNVALGVIAFLAAIGIFTGK